VLYFAVRLVRFMTAAAVIILRAFVIAPMPGSLAGIELLHEVRGPTREIVRCNSIIDPLKTGVPTAITGAGVRDAAITPASISRNTPSTFRSRSFRKPPAHRS